MPKRKRVVRVDTDSQSSHLEPDQEIQSHTRSHTRRHTHSHTQSDSQCQPQQIPSSHLGQVATWANVPISTRRELLHLLIDGHAKARPDIDATVTSLGISSATRLDQNQEQDQDQGQTQTQTQTPKQTKTTPHSLDQQVPHQQHDIPSNDILVISFCLGKLKPISKLVDPVTSPRVYASIIQYTRIVIDALESILGTPPRLETKRLNKREDHRVETDTNADTNANTGKDTGTRDMLENVLKEIMENARVEGLPLGKRRFTTWYSFVDITVEWYDTMLLQYALECVHQVLTQSNEFRTHHARAPENHHGSSRSRLLETLQRILSKLPFHDTEEMKYKCDILSDRIRSVSPQQQSDQFLIEYKLIQTYHGTENMKVQWRQILFYLENLAVVPYFAGLSRYTTAMHGVDMPSTIAKNEQGERLRQLIPPARRASSTRKQPNNPMQEALMNSQEDDRSFERHEGKEEEESEADGGDECPDEDSAFASDAEEEQEKHRVGRHRAVHVPYVPNPADGVRRGPWDVDETRLLFEGIREYGYSKWSAISRHTLMGTRTKNSIKDRCRSLGVTKSNWKSCASRWDAKVRRA